MNEKAFIIKKSMICNFWPKVLLYKPLPKYVFKDISGHYRFCPVIRQIEAMKTFNFEQFSQLCIVGYLMVDQETKN